MYTAYPDLKNLRRDNRKSKVAEIPFNILITKLELDSQQSFVSNELLVKRYGPKTFSFSVLNTTF